MKLGMPALIELPDINSNIAICKDLGLSFIELNMNIPDFCPENLAPDLIRKLSNEKNIEFTLHLPEEIDLASFHPAIRRANLDRCCEAIIWASQAGIHLVNLHINSGIFFTLPSQKVWIYEKYQAKFLQNLITSFKKLLKTAEKSNVRVCIENCNNFYYSFITGAIAKLAEMDGLFFTWDTGHDGKSGFKEKEILLKWEGKISHMHLHDYNGKSDHQVLFSGIIDIHEMLRFAGNRNLRVVIEVKTVDALKKSVELLQSFRASHPTRLT